METWAHTVALSGALFKRSKEESWTDLKMVLSDLYKSTEFNPFSPKDPAGEKD